MEDCENILEVHMELSYKLEKFEGPLDLLLHLIEKNKVNIYDIPIAEITDQYMEYVRQMDEENLDVVSEFLVMAATLLDIKARMLLPKEVNEEGEEEDPRAELVMRLLEYKKYRLMSEELKDMESGADRVFYKDPTIPPEVKEYAEPVDLDKLLDGVTLTKLQKIFESVMKRQHLRNHQKRSGESGGQDHLCSGICQKAPEIQLPADAGKAERQDRGRRDVPGTFRAHEGGEDPSDPGTSL